jgi:hypothetical protein
VCAARVTFLAHEYTRMYDCICISTVRWERKDFTLVLISAPLTWNLGLARSSIFGVGLSNLVSSL